MITCIEDEFIVIYNDSLEVLLKKLGEHFPNESSFKSMEEMSESVKDIKDSVMLRFYDLK